MQVLWEEEDTEAEGRRRICVDSMLCKHLREHQREGVQFMFGCVMGFRDFQGSGCILADDMGLGKTLQAVTLLWTLLTQGTTDQSICRRGLVVCPTSLVHSPTVFQAFFSNTRRLSFPHVCAQVTNWANEFTKCTPACITATISLTSLQLNSYTHLCSRCRFCMMR